MIAALFFLYGSTAEATLPPPRCILEHPQPTNGDWFGGWMSATRDTVAVGKAIRWTEEPSETIVFDANTCTPTSGNLSRAISHGAVVSTWGGSGQPIELNGWNGMTWQQWTVVDDLPRRTENEAFGSVRVLAGDALMVAGVRRGVFTDDKVEFYHFDGASWLHQTTVQVSRPLSYGRSAFAASGHSAVLTATSRPGLLYLLRRNGDQWLIEAELESPGGPFSSTGAVALDRNTLAFSEPSRIPDGIEDSGEQAPSGVVSVAERHLGAWTITATLPSTGAHGTFGYSLALSGNLLAIGYLGDGFPSHPGYVEVYRRTRQPNGQTSWLVLGRWQPTQPFEGDGTGQLIQLDRNRLFIAAPQTFVDEDTGLNYVTGPGRVVIIDIPPLDQDGDGHDETVDCDDLDPEVHPAAAEVQDGIDNNCDGFVDREPFQIVLPELPEEPDDTDLPQDTDDTDDTDTPQPEDPPAVRARPCGCATGASGGWWLALIAFAVRRRRQ